MALDLENLQGVKLEELSKFSAQNSNRSDHGIFSPFSDDEEDGAGTEVLPASAESAVSVLSDDVSPSVVISPEGSSFVVDSGGKASVMITGPGIKYQLQPDSCSVRTAASASAQRRWVFRKR